MLELASIHIPKTAGRSFLEILKSVYPIDTVAHFDRKNFKKKSPKEIEQFITNLKSNIEVIHGHFTYKEISELNIENKLKLVTWIRHPVERVISNYSFFKKRISLSPNNPEMQRRKDEKLREYISLETSRNRMCKFLEGIDTSEFYFIGITEYFSEEVRVLGDMLNWKPFEVPRVNDNKRFKSQLSSVTTEERKLIEELNKNDMELYNKILSHRKNRLK